MIEVELVEIYEKSMMLVDKSEKQHFVLRDKIIYFTAEYEGDDSEHCFLTLFYGKYYLPFRIKSYTVYNKAIEFLTFEDC